MRSVTAILVAFSMLLIGGSSIAQQETSEPTQTANRTRGYQKYCSIISLRIFLEVRLYHHWMK